MKKKLALLLALVLLAGPLQQAESGNFLTVQAKETGTEVVTGELASNTQVAGPYRLQQRAYYSGGYTGAYGDQLSGTALTVYRKMKEAYVDSRAAVSDHPSLTIQLSSALTGSSRNITYEIQSAMQSAYDAFAYDYPEVYWLDAPTYSYERTYSGGSVSVSKLTLNPSVLYSGAGAQVSTFDSRVNEAVNAIRSSYRTGTKAEIARAIHDYLCGLVTYNEGVGAHSAAGVFLRNAHVVCEGYAKAYKVLCRKFGLDCALVVGLARSGGYMESHMWNYVKLENGKWYLVDATWDDQEPLVYTYFLSGSSSVGFRGYTVSEEREIATNFSGSPVSKDFSVPVLSAAAYGEEAGHAHVGRTSATATDCILCGQQITQSAQITPGATEPAVPNPTIKLNVSSLLLKKGQSTKAVEVSGLAAGDSVAGWESSNTRIVKVSKKGKITAQNKTGTAKVTVTLASGLKKSITVKVQSGAVKTTAIKDVPAKLMIKVKKTSTLKPVLKPLTSKEKITYSSSNKNVATVSSKGKITAKKKGSAVIMVKAGKISVRCKVTVK